MTNPVAAVTGAAQGIGERIAQVLAQEGFQLALFDRQEIADQKGALTFNGDVTSEQDVNAFAEAIQERFGRIDVLVNNAGVALISPAEHTSLAVWQQVMAVNLTGPFLLCQAIGK